MCCKSLQFNSFLVVFVISYFTLTRSFLYSLSDGALHRKLFRCGLTCIRSKWISKEEKKITLIHVSRYEKSFWVNPHCIRRCTDSFYILFGSFAWIFFFPINLFVITICWANMTCLSNHIMKRYSKYNSMLIVYPLWIPVEQVHIAHKMQSIINYLYWKYSFIFYFVLS